MNMASKWHSEILYERATLLQVKVQAACKLSSKDPDRIRATGASSTIDAKRFHHVASGLVGTMKVHKRQSVWLSIVPPECDVQGVSIVLWPGMDCGQDNGTAVVLRSLVGRQWDNAASFPVLPLVENVRQEFARQ